MPWPPRPSETKSPGATVVMPPRADPPHARYAGPHHPSLQRIDLVQADSRGVLDHPDLLGEIARSRRIAVAIRAGDRHVHVESSDGLVALHPVSQVVEHVGHGPELKVGIQAVEGPADRVEPRPPIQVRAPGDDVYGVAVVRLISCPMAALGHVGGVLQETHFGTHDNVSFPSTRSGSICDRALSARSWFMNAGVADFTSPCSPPLIAIRIRVTDASLDPDARRTDAGSYSQR